MPDPRPIVPAFRHIYGPLEPLAYPLVRIIAGLNLIPHGMQKLFGAFGGDMEKTIQGFAGMGLEPAAFLAYYIACLEFFGGILLAVGLLTRPVAVLVFGFMLVAVVHVHLGNGFFWTKGGYEYPLMWAVLAVAIAIKGGGRFSADRMIGREL